MSFFICSNCGYGSGSWIGKCPDCSEWNTLKEQKDDEVTNKKDLQDFKTTKFSEIKTANKQRKQTGIFEFDRVLGGGIIPGEVVLLTGEPGIGKSTLLLQALQKLSTVYVSGEESAEQVRDRAHRLKIPLTKLQFSDVLQIEAVIKGLQSLNKDSSIDLLVVDSIQTIYSREVPASAGSITQLKETTQKLVQLAKKSNIPIIIVGHVTKEGDIAGPKMLEHLVDCVLLFEGEKVSHHRVLRSLKNRFGSTDEIGIFEMNENGLKEVDNPLAFLENQQTDNVPGKAIVGVAEGKRPLFFEIQTLTVPTSLSFPRRVANGVDFNKAQLLLAVVRKHLNLSMDTLDIYINVVGGVSVKSPAVDLGIIASLVSSITNVPIPKKTVLFGEVGLLGEIRPVFFQDKIIQEATRLKFSNVISSKNLKNIKDLRRILSPR